MHKKVLNNSRLLVLWGRIGGIEILSIKFDTTDNLRHKGMSGVPIRDKESTKLTDISH